MQKYPKVNGFDLGTHIPLTNEVSWVEKYWSHPLANRLSCLGTLEKTLGLMTQLLIGLPTSAVHWLSGLSCSIAAKYNKDYLNITYKLEQTAMNLVMNINNFAHTSAVSVSKYIYAGRRPRQHLPAANVMRPKPFPCSCNVIFIHQHVKYIIPTWAFVSIPALELKSWGQNVLKETK